MGKRLIIAEKPNLGRTVAAALGVKSKKDGYMESDKYIITWCFGHLFELYDVNDYLGEETKWDNIQLPFIPNPYKFKQKKDKDGGIKKQIAVVKKLVSDSEVTEIIHCGDADREGQIIVDILLSAVGNKKPVKRLWLPEQTDESIRNAISSMKDNSEYKNLYNEGMARTYTDWLLGINTTVYLTTKTKGLLKSGRVIIPIVKYIYDRDLAIENFVPEKFFMLESDTEGVKLQLKKPKFAENELKLAEEYAEKLNKNRAVVKSIETKDIKKTPPKLFSLSKLQAHLSTTSKINFETSMGVIQGLYEKGFLTYPRTNTEYLGNDEKDKVKSIIKAHGVLGIEFRDGKDIFDSSKIEGHSAITITTKKPSGLSDLEKKVYEAVYNRFMANFTKESCIVSQTKLIIEVGEDIFELKGSVIKEEGFSKYEPLKLDNKLPDLKKGDSFDVSFKPVEKWTQPPAKINEKSLSEYLSNPFKKDKNIEDMDIDVETDDSEDYKAILSGVEIGTEATRTATIVKCIELGYISLNKQVYSIEPKGKFFIKALDTLNIDLYAEKTVQMSMLLKQVYKGSKNIDDVLSKAAEEIKSVISNKNVDKLSQIEGADLIAKSNMREYKPSVNQIATVEKIAKGKGVKPPKGYKTSSRICSLFISENISKKEGGGTGSQGPSQAQINYLQNLANDLNIDISDLDLKDISVVSKKISELKAEKEKSNTYSFSEKQLNCILNPKNEKFFSKESIEKAKINKMSKSEYSKIDSELKKLFSSFKK